MRVICPCTAQYHPLAEAAHNKIPNLEQIDVSARHDTYQSLLSELWGEKNSFLIIEHDIEPNDRALRQAKYCGCLWGISPYNGPGLDPLYASLGFVRFRRQLMEEVPELFNTIAIVDDGKEISPGHWRRLDARISAELKNKHYEPHFHEPVLQHHVYRDVCACKTEHEVYPVDVEGRYKP